MTWIAAILVVLFGAAFWETSHRLHKWFQADGEQPRDSCMGLAAFISGIPVLLAPLLLQVRYLESTGYLLMMVGCPLLAAVVLALWRQRLSVSFALISISHGAVVAFLAIVDGLSFLDDCIDYAVAAREEGFVEAIGLCAQAAQFWSTSWITVSTAFITLFGAALLAVYAIAPEDFGWPAKPAQRQILAFLYSAAAAVMLIEGAVFLGVPATEFTMKTTALGEVSGLVPKPPTAGATIWDKARTPAKADGPTGTAPRGDGQRVKERGTQRRPERPGDR